MNKKSRKECNPFIGLWYILVMESDYSLVSRPLMEHDISLFTKHITLFFYEIWYVQYIFIRNISQKKNLIDLFISKKPIKKSKQGQASIPYRLLQSESSFKKKYTSMNIKEASFFHEKKNVFLKKKIYPTKYF